jgi:hypothetical protein
MANNRPNPGGRGGRGNARGPNPNNPPNPSSQQRRQPGGGGQQQSTNNGFPPNPPYNNGGGGRGGFNPRGPVNILQNNNRGGDFNGNGGRGGGPRGPPMRKNGELGASASTISENEKIKFTRMLLSLREANIDKVELPPNLTNTERKFIHELAKNLGLISKSQGKGEDRFITVTKLDDDAASKKKVLGSGGGDNDPNSPQYITNPDDRLPILKLDTNTKKELGNYVKTFPPQTKAEAQELIETGSSIAIGDATKATDDELKSLLKNLGLKTEEHYVPPAKHKSPDMTRRRNEHLKRQETRRQSPQYNQLTNARKQLPAWSYGDKITEHIINNQVTLISGDTGECNLKSQPPTHHQIANSNLPPLPSRYLSLRLWQKYANPPILIRSSVNWADG